MGENVKMSGYEKLQKAVEKDRSGRDGCGQSGRSEGCSCRYCKKFEWIIDRAKHYAEKLSLPWEDVLNSWEEKRDYWYMNYYQDCNQPEIKGDKVRFDAEWGEASATYETPPHDWDEPLMELFPSTDLEVIGHIRKEGKDNA